MLAECVLEVVEDRCNCENYEVGTVFKFFLLLSLFPSWQILLRRH
jgi:hypothetical protein